jgi:hypothetical protein
VGDVLHRGGQVEAGAASPRLVCLNLHFDGAECGMLSRSEECDELKAEHPLVHR